jgi:hypothetical protein
VASLPRNRPGESGAKPADVIELAHDRLVLTELTPTDDCFVGKQILLNGHVLPYPTKITDWNWITACIPATPIALFDYLRKLQSRNACLIRGLPISGLAQKKVRRLKANFIDEPSRLLFFDVDGAPADWRADPEAAVISIVQRLGEPWASASFVWFFSSTHGLVTEKVTVKDENSGKDTVQAYWRGEIGEGTVKVRLAFILERALNEKEACGLTKLLKLESGLKLDPQISVYNQPNYTTRPKWLAQPERDVLDGLGDDFKRIGWIKGAHDFVDVSDATINKIQWARAEGHGSGDGIASHPDALTAVCSIGSDRDVRSHMKAAIIHLSNANRPPEHSSIAEHAANLAARLDDMIRDNAAAVSASLQAGGRSWANVWNYLPKNMTDWAEWVIEHRLTGRGKTIKRLRLPRTAAPPITKQDITDRVRRTISNIGNADLGVTLVIAPTGSWKSTEMRRAAVEFIQANPGKSVVMLVPRHDLGAEQIKAFEKEHPNAGLSIAIWRGRHRDDPETPDPDKPGAFKAMCWRSEEAKELQDALIDVNRHLCGNRDTVVKCPFYKLCGFQRQKQQRAHIWLGAHELLAHEMPATFGDVGRIMIDESPLDALLFGVDANDEVVLELDALKTPPRNMEAADSATLMAARLALHQALDGITPPSDAHHGAPATREVLSRFLSHDKHGHAPSLTATNLDQLAQLLARLAANDLRPAEFHPGTMMRLEWRAKITPKITPDMPIKQIREQLKLANDNAQIKKFVTLWSVLGAPGRVQIRRMNGNGRTIHVMGLRPIAKGWQDIPTLICDATGDATLLRSIWPDLRCEVEDWQQLPRPDSVKIFQCVDRALAKSMIATEGDGAARQVREDAARRMYAAVINQALQYGGKPVGLIVYKSTAEWIRANCYVPDWLTLLHHGGVSGLNVLQDVRALFVVGRPLANAEPVTRSAEALTGEFIDKRAYRKRKAGGLIPTVVDDEGHNTVKVEMWEHAHPVAERLRRQITEGSNIQAEGRARPGLRDADSPLDIWRLHDVPLPELGEVIPVLWDELRAGHDALMLAVGGVWLANNEHAAQAYPGLFTLNTLKQARKRAQTERREGTSNGNQRGYIPYRESLIGNVPGLPAHFTVYGYKLDGERRKPGIALSLRPFEATDAFLRTRLGRVLSLQGFSREALQPWGGRTGPGEGDTPDGPSEPMESFDHAKLDAIMRQARDVTAAKRGDRGKRPDT